MFYKSTRGGERVSSAEAITKGIALDGGLFVPEVFPAVLEDYLHNFLEQDYLWHAEEILKKYLTDYTAEEIKATVVKAYSREAFPEGTLALRQVTEYADVLELWHGPTFAFKDMALQILPHLLSLAIAKTGEKKEAVILVATSGDTGKAALEGFANVDGTKIIVFYPQDGVSDIQKRQMVTQKGKNVAVIAVVGNFDDAQTGVKKIFADRQFTEQLSGQGFFLSSANSINWGRLVPQIVYYFYAYARAVKTGRVKLGEKINFSVPTGNFGNILAGFYAKRMGLPVAKFICASNANNVLADFIKTGCYDRQRNFYKTLSPSMDILVSSNLERLLYHLTGGDVVAVSGWMRELSTNGSYDIGMENKNALQENFYGCWVDDALTQKTIKDVFNKHKYFLDTHTAVAWRASEDYRAATGDTKYTIVLSTASPFKFAPAALSALQLDIDDETGAFAALERLASLSGLKIPQALRELSELPVLYDKTVNKSQMLDAVKEALAVR